MSFLDDEKNITLTTTTLWLNVFGKPILINFKVVVKLLIFLWCSTNRQMWRQINFIDCFQMCCLLRFEGIGSIFQEIVLTVPPTLLHDLFSFICLWRVFKRCPEERMGHPNFGLHLYGWPYRKFQSLGKGQELEVLGNRTGIRRWKMSQIACITNW